MSSAPRGFARTVVVDEPHDAVRSFARWVAGSVTPTSDVLNIGAGRNLSGGLRPIRRRCSHLVGIDPHENIWLNDAVDERHQATVQEFAVGHEAQFDVAFSIYVMEHVAEPASFAAACARLLRPGGVLFGLTVHKYQYFGLATWAFTRLGIAEPLLRRLKGSEVVARYHFPTEYRMNSPRQVSKHLAAAGFRSAEFRMFDKPALYQWYLPRPLKPFAPAWTRAAYALRTPLMMGHLTFRAER